MPVYGYTSVRTNNRSGPYPLPSATGQTIAIAAFFFPDGGTATLTVMTFIVTRITGATVTVSEPEHSNSRSPNQSGGGGVAESVAGTFSGNPFVIVKSAPENLYPPGHYQFPRPQARFVTNGGELSQVSTKVNPGTGISAAFGLRYADGGLGGAIDRVARRPREHGWWHRSAQKRHKVQAGTTPPASSQDVHDRANWNIMSAARQAYLRQHDMALVVRAGASGAQTTANVTDTGVTQTDSVNRAIVRRGLTDIGVSQVDTVLSAETFDLHNPFQGTSGNVISTVNSGAGGTADFFDFVTGSPVYGTAHPNSGSTSMSLQTAAGAASAGWDVSIPTTEILYGRVYWYAAAANGATTRIVTIAGDATSLLGNISLDTSNRLTANIGNFGTTVVASNPLTTGAMARIEWLITVDRHGNGMLKVRYFLSKDSLTPDEEITATNVGVPDQRIFSCSVGVTAAATVNTWLDDFEVSNAGWIGPFGGAQAFQADVTDNGVIQSDSIGRAVTRKVADTGVAQSDAPGRTVIHQITDRAITYSGYTDTFTRTVGAGGWGTDDSGETWAALGTTTASYYSVNGSTGLITPTANGTNIVGIAAGGTFADGDAVIDMAVSALPTGAQNFNMGLGVRTQATNPEQNYYRARMILTAGANPTIELALISANVATVIGSAVSGSAYVAAAMWRMRIRCQGSHLQVRAWPATAAEPSTWDVDTTDATWASGGILQRQQVSGGAPFPVFSYDNLLAGSANDVVVATFQAGGASTTRNVSDTGASQTDAVQRQIVRPVASTGVSQSDTLGRAVTRGVADTMTQTDSIGPRAITRAVTSTGLAQSDSIGPRQITRAITSTGVSQSDALSRVVVRGVADQGATQTDSPGRAVARPPISVDWTPVAGAWLLANVNLTGSNADWATREASLGRSFDGRMKYKAIDTTTLSDLNVGDTFAAVAYPTAGTLSFSGNNTIPSINAGSQDANLIAFANAVKAIAPTRVFVRLFWEFNLAANRFNPANYVDASGVAAPGTWADFQTAWIRVWTIFFGTAADFTALGITGTPPGCSHDQVKFAYNPNRKAGASPVDPTLGYPGSRYVDWIFLDTYPSRVSGATEVLDSPTVLLTKPNVASAVSWYDTFASYGKPLGIGETSVHPVDDVTTAYGSGNGVSPVTRVQWWSLWVAALKALPRVKLVTIFDANDAGYPTSNHTWKTDATSATTGDSGSQAFAAYSAFANDAWMNPSGSGGLASDTGVYFYDSLTATVSHGAVNVADTGVSQSDTLARAIVRGVASTGVSQSDTVAPTRGYLRGVTDDGLTKIVSDDANRADQGPPPSANWQSDPEGYGAGSFTVSSNQFAPAPNGSGDSEIAWLGDTFGPQVDIAIDLPIVPPVGQQVDLEILTNWVFTAPTGYDFQYRGDGTMTMFRADAGAYNALATATQVLANGDAIRLRVAGLVVECWVRLAGVWTRPIQVFDSTYRQTGIKVGFYASGSTMRIDNFLASSGSILRDELASRQITRAVVSTGVSQSDSLARSIVRGVTSTGETQTDTLATTRTRPIIDTGESQSDALARAVVRGVADTGTAQTDSVARTRLVPRNVTDTGEAQTDTIGRAVVRAVTSTGVAQTDTVQVSSGGRNNVTDTGASQTDSIARAITRPVTSTGVTQTDSVTRTRAVTRNVTDTGESQSDALAVARIRAISDTGASQTDSPATARVRAIATIGVAQTDAVGRSVTRRIADTGESQSDALGGAQSFSRNITDTGVVQSDSPGRAITRAITSTGASQSDTIGRLAVRAVSDAGVTQTDSVSRRLAATRAVADQGTTMSDSIGTTAAGHVSITDQGVSQSDSTRRAILRGVADAGTSMSDVVRAAHAIGVSDTGASMADQVARLKTAPRAPTDTGVAQTDVLARAVVRPIADTGESQTDTLSVAGHHDISITDVGVTFSDGVDLTAAGHQGVTDVGLTETDVVRRAIVRRLADVGVSESDAVVIRRVLHLFLADQGVRFFDFVGAIRRVLTSVEGATGQAQTHGATGEPQVNDAARLAGPHDGTRQPIVYAHTEN